MSLEACFLVATKCYDDPFHILSATFLSLSVSLQVLLVLQARSMYKSASPSSSTKKRKTSSPSASKPKKAKSQQNADDDEKRLTKTRGTSKGIQQRIDRAGQQRLYLIGNEDQSRENYLAQKFDVLGSTGNVYSVCIAQVPTCTCPDFAKGNIICKHVLFVYLKVRKKI